MCISCDFSKAGVFFLIIFSLICAAVFVCAEEAGELQVSAHGARNAVLFFDAGHGGEDGGAVSKNGTRESELNLDIALKCDAIADFAGADSRLTRKSERLEYPSDCRTVASRKAYDTRRRAELINSTPNALLVSIHQNFFPQGSPRGPQVFYGSADGSKELAELIQEYMNTQIYEGNRRLAVPADKGVYLMKNVKCTAVLAECGFISNSEEEALLRTPEYRTKLALVITGGCLKYLNDICEA